ncbi:hypothetical protein BDV93DRAFT_527892 [Ceratobasidium sp. AG-I]|nr:hypothetical protein BDV93DRAFT_527892 [Ceratobasidium sp. AG-I]
MDRAANGEDRYQVYLNIRNCVRLGLKAQLLGATNVLWKHVPLESKMNVSNLTLSQFAELNRFPGNWAVFEIMKRILRNSRDTKTGRKGRKSGADESGLPASAPGPAPAQQTADAADDDDDDFPTSDANQAGPSHNAVPPSDAAPVIPALPIIPAVPAISAAQANDDDDEDDDDDWVSDKASVDLDVEDQDKNQHEDVDSDKSEEAEEEEEEPVVKRKGKGKQRVVESDDDEDVTQPIPTSRRPPSPPSPPTTLGRSDVPSSPTVNLPAPGPSNSKKRKAVANTDILPTEEANKRAKVATALSREDSWRAGYEQELAELTAAPPKAKKASKKASKNAAKASAVPPPSTVVNASSAPTVVPAAAAFPTPTPAAPAPKKAARKTAKTTVAPIPMPPAVANPPSTIPPVAAKSKGRSQKTVAKVAVASTSAVAIPAPAQPAPATTATRPRPKMRPIPPSDDMASTVTTQAAKAELIDSVDAGAIGGRRSTRRKPTGSK